MWTTAANLGTFEERKPISLQLAATDADGHHHPEGTGLPPSRGYRQDQPRVTTDGGR